MIIRLDCVSFGYDDTHLFDGVSFTVNEGQRIALIGANGEGKTTIIKLMCGELTPDEGTVSKKNGLRIGLLEQNGGYESGNTVYKEMLKTVQDSLDAVKKLEETNEKISQTAEGTNEYKILSSKAESLHKFISAHDSYNAQIRVKSVLGGLGFEGQYDMQISSLSGGEKTRLKLCRLLLEEPDLLILDEPTNHLDMQTMFYLEDFLSSFKGAVFIVSHDRYFLDRTTNITLELENKRLLTFKGGYSKYKTLKEEYVKRQAKEYEKQQEEITRLEGYIAKNRVRASTAKSAQSRLRQLDKMEVMEKPYTPPAPPRFCFTYLEPPYEKVLDITALDLYAGDTLLAKDINISIKRGEKVALIGKNGTGKSTLLKLIASGKQRNIQTGKNVEMAFYDQEMKNLDDDNTVMQELWERHVSSSQTEIRSSLARCGLMAEDMYKKVSSLSGGEKAKLALCVFENEHANFLILDEPTNHLDLHAMESLQKALESYDGTVLFVSHDRYFISALAQRILEIENKKIYEFNGTYEQYIAGKRQAQTPKKKMPEKASKTPYYRTPKQRKDETKRKQKIHDIECEIASLEAEEAKINEKLSLEDAYKDLQGMQRNLARLDEIKAKTEELYFELDSLL